MGIGLPVGSTLEFAATIPRSTARARALRRGAAGVLPEPRDLVDRGVVRLAPMTPNDLPCSDGAGLDNLVVATGHGMLGVTIRQRPGDWSPM